jgi:cytochrome P450
VPERWETGQPDYRFNHLSNGRQNCPGAPLVSLIGKAVLAQILSRYSLSLESPAIRSAGGALPYSLDFFEARFAVRAR